MPCVSLEPMPCHLVFCRRYIQAPPKIVILHRLLRLRPPTVAFPIRQPPRNAILDIFGIGVEFNLARFSQGIESFDGRLQFHPVIGGSRSAAAQFPLVLSMLQYCSPSTRSGISMTSTVRMDNYLFHALNLAPSTLPTSREKLIQRLVPKFSSANLRTLGEDSHKSPR